MRIEKISGCYEVRLDNNYLAGHIIYDPMWFCWRFVSKGSCRLDFHYIKSIYKFMKRLR